MRLIGNKTRLLGEIERLLDERGIRDGTLIDIFAGTASVGRHFKKRGFRVVSNDRMSMCYAQAVAGVEVSEYPGFLAFRREYAPVLTSDAFFAGLRRRYGAAEGRNGGPVSSWKAAPLLEAIHFLDTEVEPREGLFYRNYCPGGPAERMYFRDENGRRIDGIAEFLRGSFRSGLFTREEFYLCLAALIDAADKVANISGTYGAFLKYWQPNSLKELRLEAPEVVESDLDHPSYRKDANELVRELEGDILYIDPPYNQRQYAANYHVMEILAEYHSIDDLAGFEASLYGKTGLRPYHELKSAYCVPPGGRRTPTGNVYEAMTDLILSSRARHVVVSYNEEGLLTREQIGAILAKFSRKESYDFERDFRQLAFKRFRSDSDRVRGSGKGARSYKVLDGKKRDEIAEWLFFATREPRSAGATRAPSRLPS